MKKLPQVTIIPFQRCSMHCRPFDNGGHVDNCPKHQPFVMDALRMLEKEWPHDTSAKSVIYQATQVEAEPQMVAVGGEVVGWVIAPAPQRVTYAYVNYPMRKRGIMTAALLTLGFDTRKPIAVDLWSRAASRIVERGTWRLYPTVLG
jgi:hypothetical protein